MAATQANIGTDGAEHSGKIGWPLPRRSECADRTAGTSTDRPIVALVRKHDGSPIRGPAGFSIRQQLFQQKPRVVIAQAIVFVTAIESIECVWGSRRHPAGHHEDTDRDRHLPLVDQSVEHRRGIPLDAILIDMHARW